MRPALLRLLDFALPGSAVLFWIGLLWLTNARELIWLVPAFLVSFGLYTILLPPANVCFQFFRGTPTPGTLWRTLGLLGLGAIAVLGLYAVSRPEFDAYGTLGLFWAAGLLLAADQFLAPVDRVISAGFARSVAIKWLWLAGLGLLAAGLTRWTGQGALWLAPVMLGGLLGVRLWSMSPERSRHGLMGALARTLGRFRAVARNVDYSYGALWALNAFGIVIANFDLVFFVATSPAAQPFLLLTALRLVSVAVSFLNTEKAVLAFAGDWGALRRALMLSAGFVLVCLGAIFWRVGTLEGVDLGVYLASQFVSILLMPFWTYIFLAGYIRTMLAAQGIFLALIGAAFLGPGWLDMEDVRLLGFAIQAMCVGAIFVQRARAGPGVRARPRR